MDDFIQATIGKAIPSTYYASIDAAKELTPQQKNDQIVAEEVDKIATIICVGIFALCLIAAIILVVFGFAAVIIAIPSVIGVLVFLVPAIARIISASLEYQNKENTDRRKIEHTSHTREGVLKAKIQPLLDKYLHDNPNVKRKDFQDRVNVLFPTLSGSVDGDQIRFVNRLIS